MARGLVAAGALLALAAAVQAEDPAARVRRANDLLRQGKAEEALQLYRDAQVDAPGRAELDYDAGIAQFRQGKVEEALQSFDKARAAGLSAGRVAYQKGNCLYRMKKLPEALESFREAVREDPKDQDAKFNYELVRRKMEEAKKDEDKKDEEKKDHEKKDSDKKDREKEDEKKTEDRASEGSRATPKKLPEDEAKRLLDRLAREEKEYRLQKIRERPAKPVPVEKDW